MVDTEAVLVVLVARKRNCQKVNTNIPLNCIATWEYVLQFQPLGNKMRVIVFEFAATLKRYIFTWNLLTKQRTLCTWIVLLIKYLNNKLKQIRSCNILRSAGLVQLDNLFSLLSLCCLRFCFKHSKCFVILMLMIFPSSL